MRINILGHFKTISLLIMPLCLVGCSIALTRQGQQVRMFQGEQDSSCSYLGFVDGSFGGGWGLDEDYIGARNEMLNKTGELGANWVKVIHNSGNAFSTSLSGIAYKCEESAHMAIDRNDYTTRLSPAYYESVMKGANQIGSAMSNFHQAPIQNNYSNQNQVASENTWKIGAAPFCVIDNYGNLECYYYNLQSCSRAASQKIGTAACVKK